MGVLPRRLTAGLLAMLLLTAGLLVAAVAPASAGASYFVGKINAERAEAGRKPLSSNGDLAAIALAHSKRMASDGDLYHNPKLASQVSNYQLVAENVGYGPNEATIHAAFMASAGHRANILDKRLTQVGVGVTTDAKGRVWVTEVFRLPTGATSGTAATAPKPSATPAVKPSAKPAAKPTPKPTPKPATKVASAPKPKPAPVATPKPTPTPVVTPEPRPTAAGILRGEQQPAPTPVSYTPASSPSQGPGALAVILAFGTAVLAGLGLRIPLN